MAKEKEFLCENNLGYFITSFSINLLAFYHKCRPLIGYATHVLFCAGGRFSVFRGFCKEDLDERFERLVDLY